MKLSKLTIFALAVGLTLAFTVSGAQRSFEGNEDSEFSEEFDYDDFDNVNNAQIVDGGESPYGGSPPPPLSPPPPPPQYSSEPIYQQGYELPQPPPPVYVEQSYPPPIANYAANLYQPANPSLVLNYSNSAPPQYYSPPQPPIYPSFKYSTNQPSPVYVEQPQQAPPPVYVEQPQQAPPPVYVEQPQQALPPFYVEQPQQAPPPVYVEQSQQAPPPAYVEQPQQSPPPAYVVQPHPSPVANYTDSHRQSKQNYAPQSYPQTYANNIILTYPPSLYEGKKPHHQQQPMQLAFYNKNSQFKSCPENIFVNPPSNKDIEAAFGYASNQLSVIKSQSIKYMDANAPGWASRHQLFSMLASPDVKSDEQGLLVEFASQYVSDRLCMTKWDRQRYLPSLSKIVSNGVYPAQHPCRSPTSPSYGVKECFRAKYRNYDGSCNNPWHPYWGKANVCHIRLLSPDYSDGISKPRESSFPTIALPSPRILSEIVHNDVQVDGPYNLLKMQWGQFINHDISNTAVSSYDGLVDCCKNPGVQGCYPIQVPRNDKFYSRSNVTCLNFIRSAVCPICQLGPRQQLNKNTAFLDASQVYGSSFEQAKQLRSFRGGLLKVTVLRSGELVLPVNSRSEDNSCGNACFFAGDSRVNQHPALTALHTLALRRHNQHAKNLAIRHPNWDDETLFQEARRLFIAEYQMITYNEYLPIVFGPGLSAYYHLKPLASNYTQYNPNTDPTTWNEYVTAACRFGHSQVSSLFSLLKRALITGQERELNQPGASFPLREWFSRPQFLLEGRTSELINGLLSRQSQAVDQWVTDDLRNHLYRNVHERHGGDLPATNVQRGRDHGLPSYVHYLDYCFKIKARTWRDLTQFIDREPLKQLKSVYKVVENIDLFSGGMAEKHSQGADIGPTFACINGIQYYHLKFGDRYYFEHSKQAGSFTPQQLAEIRRSTLARFLCKTANIEAAPGFAFVKASQSNNLVQCHKFSEINYGLF